MNTILIIFVLFTILLELCNSLYLRRSAKLRINFVNTSPFTKDISYATSGASGMDLRSTQDFIIDPNSVIAIPTGIFIEIPKGYEGQIRPRSGLALKHRITIENTPGTIDSDYRGEIAVILHNEHTRTFSITRGDRIAQLVICPIEQVLLHKVESLSDTTRGKGGFGHTGTN